MVKCIMREIRIYECIEDFLKEKLKENIPKSFIKACPDQIVGSLKFNFKTNEFEFRKKLKTLKNVDGAKRQKISKGIRTRNSALVMVLESPHIDEYDNHAHTPRGPAYGKTGDNINKYLCDILDDAVKREILVLKKSTVYDIIIMNAIQYQCSLGVDTLLYRDACFLKLWEREEVIESFKNRLRLALDLYNFKNVILINCCTKGKHLDLLTNHKEYITDKYLDELNYTGYRGNKPSLKSFVSREIEKVTDGLGVKLYYCSHPAAWIYKKNQNLKKEL